MSETNEPQATNEPGGEGGSARETMSMGDAAKMLGLSVAQVRRLCRRYEKDPSQGLAFAWSSEWAAHPDINGNILRGHRLPFADAVHELKRAHDQALAKLRK